MKKKKEQLVEKAFRIYCRSCGCEYIDPIDWVEQDGITECPNCNSKMRIT